MKNKAFSLVEILAVVIILGVLATMATLGIMRYFKHVRERELSNLHSSLETTFNNYRTELFSSGDSHLINITINNDMPIDFNNYITGLSYNGTHLNRTVLYGTTINLYTKGDILLNEKYSDDIAAGIPNFDSLSAEEQFLSLQTQYIIDDTCLAESTEVDDNSSMPRNHCKTENGKPIPSKDEIVCQKVIYKGETVIDDYGKTKDALILNHLCSYLGN